MSAFSCTFDGAFCPVIVVGNEPAAAAAARPLRLHHRLQLSAASAILSPTCISRMAANMSPNDAEVCLRAATLLSAQLPLDAPTAEQTEFCCRLQMDAWSIETRLLQQQQQHRTPRRSKHLTTPPPQRAQKRRNARRDAHSVSSSVGSENAASIDDGGLLLPAATDTSSETSS